MQEIIGQILAEKYRVEALLRESGMGKIYRGKHLLMDNPVAIKILSPALAVDETIVQRFSVEARTASKISHPNIVNVTDFGTDPSGIAFIIMEYAEGETLKDKIRNEGKFSAERASKILNQIAAAFANAHSHGIIHRNLSSENIQLLQTPNAADVVKILNFGAVKIDENNQTDSQPEYLSPEQCSESSEPDERSDIYSLGVVLYEMLAGEVPFLGDTQTRTMLKHVQEPPPPILSFRPDLPTETETIIQRALAKQPIQRYQNATDLSDAFGRILIKPDNIEQETLVRSKPFINEGSNLIAPPVNQVPANNIWKTAFIVLAGICVLGGSFIYMNYGKRTNPGTEMMTDANGQPVQPTNPATGSTEQDLANMSSYSPDIYGNSNVNGMAMPNDPNPLWDRGMPRPSGGSVGVPYGNSPYPVYGTNQGGTMIYTDPSGSQFMPDENNPGMFVPVSPAVNKQISNTNVKNANVNARSNTNVATVKPISNTNINAQPTAQPTPKPSQTPIPLVTPTPKSPKPTEEPKPTKPPSATEKRTQSGKVQDSKY
jgi:serine/threonine protein kinase